jgi:hypothetical protein
MSNAESPISQIGFSMASASRVTRIVVSSSICFPSVKAAATGILCSVVTSVQPEPKYFSSAV